MASKNPNIVYGEISYESEQRHLDDVISELSADADKILIEVEKYPEKTKSLRSELKYLDNAQRREYRAQMASIDSLTSDNKKKLAVIKKTKVNPYFGRIDIEYKDKKIPPKSYYLSKRSGIRSILRSRSNVEYVDWRAAIGNQYSMTSRAGKYEFPDNVGTAIVQLKSPIAIESSKITKIDEGNIIGKRSAKDSSAELLQERLSSSSSSKMTEVVETIQSEQNSLIRIPEDKNIIIQGSAGSGKSVIGLHRIAYLMYEGHKHPLRDYQTLFVSPNSSFSKYVSGVLPSLGENNIPVLTMNEIIAIALRGSNYVLDESYLQKYFKSNSIEHKYRILYSEILSERFSDVIEMINDDLKFYKNVMKNIAEQAKWHHSNIKLTRQTYQQYLENADFLAPFREQKGKKIYSSAGVYDAIIKAILTHAEIRTKINSSGSIKFHLFDDDLRQKNREILRDNIRMDEDDTPERKKKLRGDGMNQIRQVVVDEAQDYTHWHIFLLKQLFPNAHFTILGDENQNINPYIVNNKLRELAPDFDYLEIKKAYRSSPEIIEFANAIIDTKITPIRRSNNLPVKECWNLGTSTNRARNQMLLRDISKLKANGHKRIAVITRSENDTKKIKAHTDSEDFSCLPIHKAKGLEFDAAIVMDNYLENEKEMYYAACTRAQHELVVYHWDRNDNKKSPR